MVFTGKITVSKSNIEIQSLFWTFCAVYFSTLLISPYTVGFANLKASITVFGAQAALLAIVTITLGRSWRLIRQAVNAIVFLNIILVITGLTSLLISQNINFFRNGIYVLDSAWVETLRTYTVLYNPNYYARSLLLTFPFLLVPIETSKQQFYRYIVYGAAGGSLLLVILTLSRANILVLGLVLAAIFLRYITASRFNNHIVTIGIVGGGIIGLITFFPIILDRFVNKINQFTSQGTTLRLSMLQTSLESFSRHPLFGTGPDTAMSVLMSDPEMREAIITFKGRLVPLAMHNNYLLVLVEAGAVGITLLAVFLSKYWRHLIAMRLKLRNYTKDLIITVDATEFALFAFLLSGMTAVNFGMSLAWYVLAIPFAIFRRIALDTSRS